MNLRCEMLTRICCPLIVVCGPATIAAQDFGVIATSPAPGDSSVALETTVRFTFSSPLDTTARFAGPWPVEFFAIDPPEAISIDSVYFSDDLKEIAFDVILQDSTDYTWVMTGARSVDSVLACPFVLNYTTSDGHGPFRVSGMIGLAFLVKTGSCQWALTVGLRNAPYDKPGHLVSASSFIGGGNDSYVVTGVRPGTYWPVAYFDNNGDGVIRPDWSSAPGLSSEATRLGLWTDADSIVVFDQSLANVDMVFFGGATETDPLSSGVSRLSAFPNPFTSDLSVTFETVRAGEIQISLYDILGRQIGVISDGFLTAGPHEMPVAV
ncbi:MAG: hypothetical protein WBW88_09685, partial [Rhodothermales bacterium]